MSEPEDNIFDRRIKAIMDNAEEEVPGRVWDSLSARLDGIEYSGKRRRGIMPWIRYSSAVAAAAAVALGVFFGVRSSGPEAQDNAIASSEQDTISVIPPAGDRDMLPSDGHRSAMGSGTRIAEADIRAVSSDGQETISETGNTGIVGTEDRVPTTVPDGGYQGGKGTVASDDLSGNADTTTDSTSDPNADQTITGSGPAGNTGGNDDNTDIKTGADNADGTGTGAGNEDGTDRDGSIASQIRNSSADTYMADVWDAGFSDDDEDKGRSGIHTALTISGLASSNSRSGNSSGGISRPMMSVSRPGSATEGSPVKENEGSCNYGIPLSFGLGAKIIFTPRWSLGVGVNFSMLSRTFSGTYTTYAEDGAPTVTPYSKIRNVQSYVGIPVNAYFSIVKSKAVDFYAYAGGIVEKCVSNRFRMAETDGLYREKVEGFQFSANAGLGVEFIVADMLGIYIDPSIRYYFPDDRQPKSIRTIQPLTLGFEMGFRVRL